MDTLLVILKSQLRAVAGSGGEEIRLDAETLRKARVCMDRMLESG